MRWNWRCGGSCWCAKYPPKHEARPTHSLRTKGVGAKVREPTVRKGVRVAAGRCATEWARSL